jgi:hypothetical protein
MDISDATLIAISSVLVLGSSTVIIMVNYRRCCSCLIKQKTIDKPTDKPIDKPSDKSLEKTNVINPVNEWT